MQPEHHKKHVTGLRVGLSVEAWCNNCIVTSPTDVLQCFLNQFFEWEDTGG